MMICSVSANPIRAPSITAFDVRPRPVPIWSARMATLLAAVMPASNSISSNPLRFAPSVLSTTSPSIRIRSMPAPHRPSRRDDIARAPDDRIVLGPGVDDVGAPTAADEVVVGPTLDRVGRRTQRCDQGRCRRSAYRPRWIHQRRPGCVRVDRVVAAVAIDRVGVEPPSITSWPLPPRIVSFPLPPRSRSLPP